MKKEVISDLAVIQARGRILAQVAFFGTAPTFAQSACLLVLLAHLLWTPRALINSLHIFVFCRNPVLASVHARESSRSLSALFRRLE